MENKPEKRIVIFEYIGYYSIPILFYYLKRNYRITYFTINQRLSGSIFFKKLISNRDFTKTSTGQFDIARNSLPHNFALDNVEFLYEIFFLKDKLILLTQKFFESELIHFVFKKALVEKLYDFYRMQLFLNDIAHSEIKKVYFIPSGFTQTMNLTKALKKEPLLDQKICIPLAVHCSNLILNVVKKAIHIVLLFFFPLWILMQIKRVSFKGGAFKKYKIGIRVYQDDLEFKYKYRSVDFLLNNKDLNSQNTLFCIDTGISDDYFRKLNQRGYNLVELPKILECVDWKFITQTIFKKFLPYWVAAFFLSFWSSSLVIKMTIKILYKNMLWSRFLQRYQIEHYVVVNDNDAVSVARNILLSQKGVKTWYYLYSCNFGEVYVSLEKDYEIHHVAAAYLYYDNLVAWSKVTERFFRNHPNHISNFLNNGVIWSEHIKILLDSEKKPNLLDSVCNKFGSKPNKIIGVFDTTFGEESPLKFNDIVSFIDGIVQLLEDYPDIAVIFKKKWLWKDFLEREPKIAFVYEKLHSHPRCYTTNDEERDSADVIAISDLVVAACFTSSTIEALGAKKKAIYFDATNLFKGFYYDKFPHMVAHGYAELKKLVHYWLYENEKREFDKYLESYVRGELDAYVDGQAITRFRQALLYS